MSDNKGLEASTGKTTLSQHDLAKALRLQSYATRKHSDIEWLGEIPAHWNVAPVYARYEVALGKMLDAKRVTGDFSGSYLRNIDVQWDAVNTEGLPEMDFAPSERDRYLLRPGDLLVCEGGEVGRTAIWRGEMAECFYQKAIHRVRPRSEKETPRFFYYLMYTLAKKGVFVAGGNPNTIDHLTAVQLRHCRVPFAPPSEQRTIAGFLDRETARIDGLVAKKERLIELLQEKRAALITQAVTRGLDPTVAMKDSGVEWLGQVPADWNVLVARRLIDHIEQGWSPVAEDREATIDEWGVIKLSAVNRGRFVAVEHKALPADLAADTRYEIRDGDFLLTRANTPALVGDVCTVQNPRPGLMLCDLVYRLQLRANRVAPRYLTYWFLSSAGRYQIEVEARGSSQSMVKVSQGLIRAWTVVLPPLAEQHAIVAILDEEIARLDGLIAKISKAIERLKELRTALISAAVTGKIDVRAA
ncbi:MAG: restriction endonuclease subunit S [Candidatus Rokuibacteriota bacterium]